MELSRGARGAMERSLERRFYRNRRGKGSTIDISPKVGALSTNGPRCRSSSAILSISGGETSGVVARWRRQCGFTRSNKTRCSQRERLSSSSQESRWRTEGDVNNQISIRALSVKVPWKKKVTNLRSGYFIARIKRWYSGGHLAAGRFSTNLMMQRVKHIRVHDSISGTIFPAQLEKSQLVAETRLVSHLCSHRALSFLFSIRLKKVKRIKMNLQRTLVTYLLNGNVTILSSFCV